MMIANLKMTRTISMIIMVKMVTTIMIIMRKILMMTNLNNQKIETEMRAKGGGTKTIGRNIYLNLY